MEKTSSLSPWRLHGQSSKIRKFIRKKNIIQQGNTSMSHTQQCIRSLCSLIFVLGFASIAPAQISTPTKYHPDSLLSAAREVMGMQTYCALVTLDSPDRPNVRTINPFPPESDMVVWMATSSRTRKAADILRNPVVSLYYADHASARGYVTHKTSTPDFQSNE